MHMIWLIFEEVSLTHQQWGMGKVSVVNEIECKQRLTKKLLAVPPPHTHTNTHSRPPPGVRPSAPLCLPVPRLHAHTKTCRLSYKTRHLWGFFCCFCFFSLSPHQDYFLSFDLHDFARDAVGIFFRSLCQQNIKSLHKHIEIIGAFNLRTYWMNGAF